MNTKRLALISLFIGLQVLSAASRADDIDLYSALNTGSAIPNIMVVVDNPSSQNNNVAACTYWDGTTPSNYNQALGADQCALVNLVHNLSTRTDGTALLNLGFTTMNGVDLPLTPINDNTYTGPSPLTVAGNSVTIPSGTTNRGAIILAVKALSQTVGKSGQGTELQETWAYFSGGNGTYGGVNTAQGSLSGNIYTGTPATSSCQKNYIIYLSNVKAGASHAQDNGELPYLDAAANNANSQGVITATQLKKLDPSATGYTGTIPNKPEAGYGIEWARFMLNADINSTSTGVQNIITYSVATGDTAVPITNTMERYIQNVGLYGGGKYFAAGNDPAALQSDILKIFNEIQAVNSVFSSSSLPVSVNAQGTFLNQIYMGMFRPDSSGSPRWVGNLKQYQFRLDPSTGALQLGDSVGNPAISSAGTGFISANAISFWTCTNLTTSPYPNSYLTATPANLKPAQITLLGNNHQGCSDPLPNGFWANDPGSLTATALGFDLPDGEHVERGGAAQQIRQINLTNNYATSPASPRNLYTWCPSGSGCVNDLTNSANAFATTNSALVATAFGATLTANISSIARTGGIVTVTTTGSHGFSTGDSITIANANPSDYNGTFNITVVDTTHFTYSITVHPPTPATGSYHASLAGTPVNVSTLTRSGDTVTVTTTGAHGFLNGTTVIIAGASPNDYNGSFPITSVPTTTTFTYTLNEQPATVAGSGTATYLYKTTPSNTYNTVAINAWNAAAPGIQRSLGSTTVTVNTAGWSASQKPSAGNSFSITGVLDSNGASVGAYNVTNYTIVSVTGSSFTFTIPAASITPSTPANGTITASAPTGLEAISSLSLSGTTVTATTAAALPAGFVTGATVNIGGTTGANENAYTGSFPITMLDSTHFTYTIVTTPTSPASATVGTTMNATRSSGFTASNLGNLINWVRGEDNLGDEPSLCPPNSAGVNSTAGTGNCPTTATTIRPSVHGDVLHSRPTVINYGSYSVAITATSDSGTTRTATASASDITTIASTGATPVVTFANGAACPVTVASTTTFTYQNTSCGAPDAQTASVGSKVVVFYGDNNGVFHAINGNQTALFGTHGPGDELWGFIPKEFFLKLNRIMNNSPQLNMPRTPPGILPMPQSKDYFIDGATGIYQTMDSNGSTTRAVLYLSMRRGGNFLYALDVTDPAVPTVLWKVDPTGFTNASGFTASTDYSELGQTWSQPKVAKVKGYCGGATCSSANPQTPVLIFGGGYDTNEDHEPPPLADTSGRALYVLDALTGAVVWKATPSTGSTSCSGNTFQASCVVSGMNYSLPADITLVDRNQDGFIDRLYAADVGGNIWRVDLEPSGNATPDNWSVHQLAALGCGSGACTIPSDHSQRKFFYPPEVITATTAHNFDSVIAGSGDREHPLYVNTLTQRNNRLYLLKDTYTGDNASGMTTPITMSGTLPLFDATSTPWDGTLNGYYYTLADGEKVVNAPLVTAGFVYLGTNQPAPSSTTSCTNLGLAQGYQLAPYTGTVRKVVFSGGGLPPSPVSGVVNIVVGGVVKQMPFIIGGGNPDCVGSDCTSALGGQKPPINVSTKRSRTYWYIENK